MERGMLNALWPRKVWLKFSAPEADMLPAFIFPLVRLPLAVTNTTDLGISRTLLLPVDPGRACPDCSSWPVGNMLA